MRLWLYSAVLYLITPLVLLRLWRKGKSSPKYRQRIPERFAFGLKFSAKPRICLHAVSVGESIAAAPLIRRLLAQYPNHALLVTTTTPTGSDQLRRMFPDEVEHVYFPYDLPDVVVRFLRAVKPELVILMETEIWLNFYSMSNKRGIPLLLVNARLSEKSFSHYSKLSVLMKETLGQLSSIIAQGKEDAQRFKALGAPADVVKVAGNIKYDISIPNHVLVEGEALRTKLGIGRPIWIAASTHEGEDELVLSAHRAVLSSHPEALLILVPRHPERFESVAQLCVEKGFDLNRRSEESSSSEFNVFLGDSMGELMLFYAASDIAFVGGSLVNTGGHNPLEPASFGLPVITGMYIHNFEDVYAKLMSANAAIKVNSEDKLSLKVIELLKNRDMCEELGGNAQQVVEGNQGGVEVILEVTQRHLEKE